MSYKILLVDDETIILDSLKAYLLKEQYQVETAVDGPAAIQKINSFQPDLIVLDIMLPEIDGVEILRQLRNGTINEQLRDIYVLMLTARADEIDKIVGLTVGADDYVTKPFSPRELIARIKAILRRQRDDQIKNDLIFDHIHLNLTARQIWKDRKLLDLTPIEFDLLSTLAQHHGQALSREQLIEHVWGNNYYGDDRVVDVHIGRLRKKIELNAETPQLLTTVRGFGYRFIDRES